MALLTDRNEPGLLRQLGVVSATALVVSNMVGTGIFTSTGYLAGQLGSPSIVLLSWAVGAICALAGALCYSELGVNLPSSGGEYVYLTRAYGPTWGFMTGWVSFFAGFSAPIAAAALAFSDYLGYFWPALSQANPMFTMGQGDWVVKVGGAQITSCLLVGFFTALNCFGVKRVARVQNTLTSIKVLVIVAFIFLGFVAGKGSWEHFSMVAQRTTTTPLPSQFAISLFFIYTAYSGWNAATYVAEEINQPSRTLPISLALGTGIVALLYIGLNVIFIYGLPLQDMIGVVRIGSVTAVRLFGPDVAGAFSALMALGLMSTVSAMVTIGPRVSYAMATNGAFFSAAARVHPRWHTPVVAILAQCACTMLMTTVPFQELLFYIGFTLNIPAVMSVASLFLFRRQAGWRRLPAVDFLWPLIPAVFMVVGVWITIFGMRLQPTVSFAAILTVATGALLYRIRLYFSREKSV